MATDLDIARSVTLQPIAGIAHEAGITLDELEPYGHHMAKVRLSLLDRLNDRPLGKLVVVTAITPTPLGEGKTVTTIGASLGLAHIGESVFTCIRQPSMGPVFGIKGGAAGGGHAQIVPMEEFNLHLTSDIHAITAAHNLGAAALDSRLYHEQRKGYDDFEARTGLTALRIDPEAITWKRVVDINDRALREIEIGLPSPGEETNENGIPRRSGFDITVASELMAILGLASDLKDLRRRVGRIVMARDEQGRPVTAEDVGVAGAMTVLLRDAIKPTLMQSVEHTPCFVHTGPFANIAHGNSSIVADRIALRLADYVVTEAGFGSDMGLEKFCNVKTRFSGNPPQCVVMVATLRALKMHSGRYSVSPGRPLDAGLVEPNAEALDAGLANLRVHVENARGFGVPVVVAVNRFPDDTDVELEHVQQAAERFGAHAAVVSDVHHRGGEGGADLARAIVDACEQPSDFRLLYDDGDSLREKITAVARRVYRAGDAAFFDQAQTQIDRLEADGYGNLPVCMAKTHLSISHDAKKLGAPEGYTFPVKGVYLSAGAGFVYVLADKIRTMPGLGSKPAYLGIDIDDEGNVVGLS
ncbi:MAG: formate--tetrahydrofolate ligase [Phycisphaeraceae bacterium]